MAADKDIRPIDRFITTHNAEGKAVFSSAIPEAAPIQDLPGDAQFSLCYTTNNFPIDLTNDKDIPAYKSFIESPPGLTVSNGSVLRVVDMKPGLVSPMHRTVSLDYGVVLEGEVELILDSGEKRLLKRGDIAVQRGTNHAWRNTSETSWSRMLYVLLPAEPLQFGAKALGETDNIPGVRTST